MKRGFTILELLVASMLLGMLMTILTMVFNQSSIAWRTGKAVTDDMRNVRKDVAIIREQADDAFVWAGELRRHTGLWNLQGNLRDRSCDVSGSDDADQMEAKELKDKMGGFNFNRLDLSSMTSFNVGSSKGASGQDAYTVNVKSAGPNGQLGDWDDIWSWPDQWD